EIFDKVLRTARQARTELDRIPGIDVMEDDLLGVEASHDLDRLQVLMDISETGVSGYEADAWLRNNHRIDMGLSDHRRLLATLSFADNAETVDTLVAAMNEWRAQASPSDTPQEIHVPEPDELLLETAML